MVLLPFALASQAARSDLIEATKSWRAWILASLMTLYYVTATAAFVNAPIGEVALLIASAPALSALWDRLAGHPTKSQTLVGAVLAVIGVAIVALPAQLHSSKQFEHHIWGVLLALGSALCAAGYAHATASLAKQGSLPNSLSLGVQTCFLGGITLGITLLQVSTATLESYSPQLLGIGALCTALPTVCFAAASQRLPRGLVTIFTPVVAVTANLAAALTVHELPTLWAIPGGLMVVVGVFLTLK